MQKHGSMALEKKNATIVTLIFNNYTHCNLEFRHLFVNFGHTGTMHHSKKNKSCWAHVVPGCWRTTYFDMLVNYHFTTAAYTRFQHKLVPGRIGRTLDTHQPEEQHGLRSKCRFEKHCAYNQLFPCYSDRARDTRLAGTFRSFKSNWPCSLP